MKHPHFNSLLRLFFQALLYSLLFIIFFGVLSISNPQLLKLSRTAVITMGAFVACLVVMINVYGGLDLGLKPKRSVFTNLILVIFFTDALTYLFLQIMNVNPSNPEANKTLILLGEDFLLLCIAFVLQVVCALFLIILGYRIYFQNNPPRKCLLITSSQELADHLAHKIISFRQRFALSEVVHYQCPDLDKTILKYNSIFLAGLPDNDEVFWEGYCYNHKKNVYLMAELEDVIVSSARSAIFEDTPFLHIRPTGMTPMQRVMKRSVDIAVSVIGLILTSPILLISAAVLKTAGNGSVFFLQERASLNGKVFRIIKFRTMFPNMGDENSLSTQQGDARITPVGAFLRKYRIDELPQLINVLKGDMSIVGPRPEMLENVRRYTEEVPEFRYRQRMKAGITGLAQIEGKYNTSPKDKAMLDLLYIENFSLSYDFKLMLRTLTVFFRRDSTEGFGESKTPCLKMRTEALPAEEPILQEIPAAEDIDQSTCQFPLDKAQ